MHAEHAEDPRQRVADIAAVMVLTQFNLRNAEADLSRLGSLVAAYCAGESPAALHRYSEMDWQQAVQAIKVAFSKHQQTEQSRDAPPPSEVDGQIGKCLAAAFMKFVTFRSIYPDWYAPHLANMRLASEETA